MISIEKASYNPVKNALRFVLLRKYSHFGNEAKQFFRKNKDKALIIFGHNGEVINSTMAYNREKDRIVD